MDNAVEIKNANQIEPPLGARLQTRIATKFVTRWNEQWGGRFIIHGRNPGADAVLLNGNDYLGVTGHAHIVNAQTQALRHDKEFVVQSGVFLLQEHPSRQFEKRLARFMGKSDGVVCQSGYTANMGLIQAIADEQTPIYMDALAHTSLWEGARAANAPTHAFRHNDPEHLDRMMKRHGPGLVIVDSVYSTTGAMCRLLEILAVSEANNGMILVDESHSLGTHGPHGAGLCVELGVSHRVHFITASLAKAFAGRAGFFTVPPELRYYVLTESFPNIFSSCLLPHEIAGLNATLDVIERADEQRTRLHALTKRLRSALVEQGYPIHQGTEQIISLEAGLEPDTMILRDQLEERGVFGAVFCAPATSRNRSMVRLTLSAALTDAEVDHVERVTAEVAERVKPWNWPIARRLSH
jgi:CAI-1 autoinducer synthase